MEASEEQQRKQALKHLKKKRDYKKQAFTFIVISGLLVAIWALSGAGFFWPAFPMGAFALALIFGAWNTFTSDSFSEEDIQREIERKRK